MAESTENKKCPYCSKKACKKLGIEDRPAFRAYCEAFKQHEEKSTKDEFEDAYIGDFWDRADFARYLFEQFDDHYDSLNIVLKKAIDWDIVWNNIQHDYVFENGHGFWCS